MRIVAPMPQEGGPRQNQQQKNFFFARRFQTTSKQKCSNVRPLLSITFPQGLQISKNIGHPTSGSGGKKTVNGTSKVKKIKKNLFFARRFQTIFKQKCSYLRPLLSITLPQGFQILKNMGHPTLESGGKKTVKRYLKSEKSEEKKLFFARRFQPIFKQKCSYLRPLLSITFPQGFQISRNIGHPTSGSGGKKTVKRYLKSEQTAYRQTDGRTNRLTESIGPDGRCFENSRSLASMQIPTS